MKKYYLFLLLTLMGISTYAQKHRETSEKEFQAKKQAYLTEQAGLTEGEAAKFFPIYFELQSLKREINRKAWQKGRKGREPQTTEAEYEEILNGFIESEEQNNRLDKEYLKKYQSVLSNQKIFRILHAEIKFNRNMIKIMQTSQQK